MKLINILFFFFVIQIGKTQSWEKLPGELPVDIQTNLITRKGELFLITTSGSIYHSVDKGESWTKRTLGIKKSTCSSKVLLLEAPDGSIFLQLKCNLYRWNSLESRWLNLRTGVEMNDINITDRNIIYAVDYHSLYVSADNALTFNSIKLDLSSNVKLLTYGNGNNFLISQYNYFYYLYVFKDDLTELRITNSKLISKQSIYHKQSNSLIYLITDSLVQSFDKGLTHSKFGAQDNGFQNLKYIIELEGDIYAIDGGSSYRTSDGKNWVEKQSEILLTSYSSNVQYSVSDNEDILKLDEYESIYQSNSGKIKNIIITDINSCPYNLVQYPGNNLICKTHNKWYIHHENKWLDLFRNNPYNFGKSIDQITQLPNKQLLASSYTQLLISEDNGESWNKIKLPEGTFYLVNLIITDNYEIIFYSNGKRYLSNNLGLFWEEVKLPLTNHIESHQIFKSNDIIYIILSTSLLSSFNYGLSWDTIRNVNTRYPFFTIYDQSKLLWYDINPFSRKNYFYLSNDYSRSIDSHQISFTNFHFDSKEYLFTFTQGDNSLGIFNVITKEKYNLELNNIPNSYFNNLSFIYRGQNNDIYLGFYDGGIYRYENFLNTINTDNKYISETIKVYPNPTSNILTLSFDNKLIKCDFKINLIDLQGKVKYSTTIQQNYAYIETSEFSKGIYFLEVLSKNNRKEEFKILLE